VWKELGVRRSKSVILKRAIKCDGYCGPYNNGDTLPTISPVFATEVGYCGSYGKAVGMCRPPVRTTSRWAGLYTEEDSDSNGSIDVCCDRARGVSGLSYVESYTGT